MKKIITLIIALMTFVTGTQVAHAQTLNVIVESGMNINDQENSDVQLAINALVFAGQIEYVPLSDEVTGITSTKTGKLLLSGTDDGFITVSPDVTTNDDIYYIITDADRAVFEEADMDEMMRPYRSIKMHFVPGSGGNIDKAALIGTIKNGMNFEDSEYTWMAIVALTQYFNQLKMEYELDEDGEFTGGIFYLSKDDKLLFILDKNNIITIVDGVTSADNIIYTITQEDRDRLSEDPEAYAYFANYQTVELHFDTSGDVPTQELVISLQDGMDLSATENDDAENAIYVLTDIGVLWKEYNEVVHTYNYYSTATNRQLFYTFDDCLTLDPEVGPDDDIDYTLTEEDRDKLRGWYKQYMEPYSKIVLHFPAKNDLEATLYDGLKYVENDETHYAVRALVAFNQLLSKYDSDTNTYKYLNATTHKTLFTTTSDNVVTIASDVTASDDLYFVITDEDRDNLTQLIYSSTSSEREELTNLYWFLTSYGTIKLHFDTSSSKPERHGTLGNQGIWYFADGVLTVDYVGAMPQDCTSKTTDPEVAYRLKWIDFLADIKEIVITGKDVEIQPYFLYYSGDGDLGQHPDDHIKKLTLGSGVKKIGKQALATYDLKDVYCYGIEPPELSSDTGGSNVFWKKRIEANQAFLHLVQGASTGYARVNSEWAFFNHSAHALDPEDDPVKIVSPLRETEEEAAIYNVSGQRLNEKHKGINIIRYSDGTTKKVLVK